MKKTFLLCFLVGLFLPFQLEKRIEPIFSIDRECREKFEYYDNVEKYFHSTTDKKAVVDSIVRKYGLARMVRRGEVLYVHGKIEATILEELKSKKTSVLVLNSGGGFLDPMREIASFVRENKITTYIPPGALCASACAQIFAAGVDRVMGYGSWLMFHQPRLVSPCLFQYQVVKAARHGPLIAEEIIRLRKASFERKFNKNNLILLEYLGIDFLDHYLFSLKKLEQNKIKKNNLLGGSDVYISAKKALRLGAIDRIDGSVYELNLTVNGHSVEIQKALKKPKRVREQVAQRNSRFFYEAL